MFKSIPWDWDRLLYLEIDCFVTVTVICLLVCLCVIERLDVWSSYCVIATETLAGSEVTFCHSVFIWCLFMCWALDQKKCACLFAIKWRMSIKDEYCQVGFWVFFLRKGGGGWVLSFKSLKWVGHLFYAMHTFKLLLMKEITVPYLLKG